MHDACGAHTTHVEVRGGSLGSVPLSYLSQGLWGPNSGCQGFSVSAFAGGTLSLAHYLSLVPKSYCRTHARLNLQRLPKDSSTQVVMSLPRLNQSMLSGLGLQEAPLSHEGSLKS